MNATKTAYAAGVFDGEGSIMIYKSKESTKYKRYHYRISVSSTTKPLIVWLQKELGGSFNAPKQRPNRKQDYVWTQHSYNAVATLVKFFPYLIVKRSHAAVFFKFYKTFTIGRKRSLGLDEATVKERDSLIEQMHTLNTNQEAIWDAGEGKVVRK